MRLFVAVNFPDEVKTGILAVQQQLRSQVIKGNFTRPENLHLTLAFLGEIGPDKLPGEKPEGLFRIMEEVQSPPFDISFNHTGCFTHSHKELWWLGADPACPGLVLLRAIHEQLCLLLEDVDKRSFNAHITLGREIKHARPIVLDSPDISVRVDHFSLMKSEHVGGKLTYTELMQKKLEDRRC